MPFRSGRRGGRDRVRRTAAWFGALAAGALLLALAGALWFVVTARQVSIHLDPAPDALSLSGGWLTPRIGDHYLLRPGSYALQARPCLSSRYRAPLRGRRGRAPGDPAVPSRNSPAVSAFRPIATAGRRKRSRGPTSPSTADRSAPLRSSPWRWRRAAGASRFAANATSPPPWMWRWRAATAFRKSRSP
ncbi:MAG: hypothetical protein MZU95_00910 [Desulfomicrobium escambiense]|nr:hypothetical protein [Desulfomicrobium escambiense]